MTHYTSAVGLYSQGMSVSGAEDMAGNHWEWCLNKFDDLDHTEVDATNDPRVLRGGAWSYTPGYLRSAYRYAGLMKICGNGLIWRQLFRDSSGP